MISWFLIHLEISSIHLEINAQKSIRKIILACDSISKNWHVINLQTEKEPPINFFDFGGFCKICNCYHMTKSFFAWYFGQIMKSPPPKFFFFNSCVLFCLLKGKRVFFGIFFTGSLTGTELKNHRYDKPAEVIWVWATSAYYHFLPGISGSLKILGLSIKRRIRTHLLRKYSYYSVSSTNQATFFIGGSDGSSLLSIIAKYENDNWSLYGNLNRRRAGHGSIISGTATIVIGGGTDGGS